MRQIIIDTSAIVAVLVNESAKPAIIQATQDAELLAPASVHWEIANAFSAMFRRNRLSLDDARKAIVFYYQIPIRFVEVELEESLEIAYQLKIYAYDAYLLRCAKKYKASLLSLDKNLLKAAEQLDIDIVEVD